MTTFRPGQGYPAPHTTEEALRAIKVPSGPAPGATTRPDPSTEKRVVLIKPGDVLLIDALTAEQIARLATQESA